MNAALKPQMMDKAADGYKLKWLNQLLLHR